MSPSEQEVVSWGWQCGLVPQGVVLYLEVDLRALESWIC